MSAHVPLVAALWAGLNGLLTLVLAINVSRTRLRLHVDIGDGGNATMARAIRVHANNVEYVPLILVLLLLIDLIGGPAWLIHGLGGALLAGRIAHAVGLGRAPGVTPGRSIGITLSWGVLLVAAAYLLWQTLVAA